MVYLERGISGMTGEPSMGRSKAGRGNDGEQKSKRLVYSLFVNYHTILIVLEPIKTEVLKI